jgi:hypothetical protein
VDQRHKGCAGLENAHEADHQVRRSPRQKPYSAAGADAESLRPCQPIDCACNSR